jgi:hypothetical protein
LDKVILEIIKPHKFVLSSSREFVSLKKKILIAGLPEFYCGSNAPSHASQFKWLEYTFNGKLIKIRLYFGQKCTFGTKCSGMEQNVLAWNEIFLPAAYHLSD